MGATEAKEPQIGIETSYTIDIHLQRPRLDTGNQEDTEATERSLESHMAWLQIKVENSMGM